MRALRQTEWQSHHGGSGDMGGTASGIWGKLTECQLPDGLVFYVRENMALTTMERFTMPSNARQGMKRGTYNPGRQVLEVAAPADRWDDCATAVRAMAGGQGDTRDVRRNLRFTMAWAGDLFRRAAAGTYAARVWNLP